MILGFMMVQKRYASSRNHTWNFECWSSPGPEILGPDLSRDAGQPPQSPVSTSWYFQLMTGLQGMELRRQLKNIRLNWIHVFLAMMSWLLFRVMFLQGLFGKKEFLYQTRFFRQFAIYLCGQMIIDQICSNVLLLMGGFNTNNMNMVSGSLVNASFSKAKRGVTGLTSRGWASAVNTDPVLEPSS